MNKNKTIQQYLIVFMRFSLAQIILMAFFATLASAGIINGQGILEKKISIEVDKTEIKNILAAIEKKADVRFTYSAGLIDAHKEISIHAVDTKLSEVLDNLFEFNVVYSVNRKQIILKPKTKVSDNSSSEKSSFNSATPEEYALIISGKVVDSDGQPIPGVNVLEKGTTNGSVTDTNGVYSIDVVEKNSTLVFSFIGFLSQEVQVGEQMEINVTLATDIQTLGEVVVVGYGTVKKSDLTGAVSTVNKKEFGDRIVTDVSSLIQGRAAGVDVSGGRIRVRGVTTLNNSDPLVVVDGFFGGSLQMINPNDIESIEILKDASATAIYGSQGANGVILVTTKSGKAGPLKVNINAYTGIGATPKKLDVLSASQYIDYLGDALGNAGQSLTPELQDPARRQDVTNWQDEVFRTAHNSEIDIDFSGGTENANFFVAIGYRHNEGITINPESDNVYLRNKNDFKLAEWLKFGNNFSFNYNDSTGSAPWDTQGMIGMPPYYGVFDPTNLGGYTNVNRATDLTDVYNPIPMSALSDVRSTGLTYQTNLYAEVEPINGLTYRIQAGVNGGYYQNKTWNDEYINGGTQYNINGIYEGSRHFIVPLVENILSYKRQLGKHDISVMVGNTWKDHAGGGGISIFGQGYDNTEVKNVFLADSRAIGGQNAWKDARLSYYGRVNYQFNDRYLLTFNYRQDASPRFAPQYRWAKFPSIALAWKMHEESFIQNLEIFDQLKLRASWGISGNDLIPGFRYSTRVWTNGVYYPLGGNPIPGATANENASPDIRWESTESKSIGIDAAFLNNALSVTAEYFVKNTDDILFTVPRPASLGFGLAYGGDALINAASIVNRGLEFQANYQNAVGAFTYSINGNYTHIYNEVTSLGLGQPYLSGVSRTDVGNPIGYFYGFVADGIFETQAELDAANASAVAKGFGQFQEASTGAGDVRYKDINGDGVITFEGDRKQIGNSIPKHMYGANLNFGYKGFDLNVFFQGIAGSDIFYNNHAATRGGTTTRNQLDYVLNRWRSEEEPGNGTVPRAVVGDPGNNSRPSTLMVSSGDYLKIRQLSVGYSFPSPVLSKMKVASLRLYVSASNLFTFSKYDLYDAEVGGDNLNRGIDYLGYPNPRTIVFGLKAGL